MRLFNVFSRRTAAHLPAAGVLVHQEAGDRYLPDPARGIAPERVDEIMQAANSGEVRDQARLAEIIAERDHTIAHALETRRNQLLGVPWHVEAGGDKSPADIEVAEELERQLRNCGNGRDLDGFYGLVGGLLDALLPGYAVAEIVWQVGGALAGFQTVPVAALSFSRGLTPRLTTTDHPQGVDLPDNKFLTGYRCRGADPVRGGLIRPLAWLYCFGQVGVKDMLAFIERFGMPFLLTKVNEQTYNDPSRLEKLKRLIRNFGPCGGGVFTEAVQAELLQAANSSGDVYFRLLEYLDAAKTKVLLGQTASSSDGGGLSGDGEQGKVRQDILEADAAYVQGVIQSQLIPQWTRYNYGDQAAVPTIVFEAAPPADEQRQAEIARAKIEAIRTAIECGALTATADVEAAVRKLLDLSEMPAAALADWRESGGVRRRDQIGGMALSLEKAPASTAGDEAEVDDLPPLSPEALTAFDDFSRPLVTEVENILGNTDADAALRELKHRLPELVGRANAEKLADYMAAKIDKQLIAGRENADSL